MQDQQHNRKKSYDFDLAIITAVPIEHEILLKSINAKWSSVTIQGDSTEYLKGELDLDSGNKIKLVTATMHQMGMPAASVLSMKIIENFRPKYLVMVGIAAGNRDQEVDLGDILIASEAWDYGSGKIKEAENSYIFQPSPQQIELDVDLKEKFKKNYKKKLYEIKDEFVGPKPKEELKVHVGPMASGAAVIQDERIIKEFILKHNRKLIGIEMETYGVYYAAKNAIKPKPIVFSMKSVCDFADASKADNFQAYAAFTSCKFLDYIIKEELQF